MCQEDTAEAHPWLAVDTAATAFELDTPFGQRVFDLQHVHVAIVTRSQQMAVHGSHVGQVGEGERCDELVTAENEGYEASTRTSRNEVPYVQADPTR